MGRNLLAFAGVTVVVALVGQYVHARSARNHAGMPPCHITTDAGPTSAPAATPYDDPVNGISFARPAGWTPKTADGSISFNDARSSASLHLDVPSLAGFNRPWIIPMFAVSTQYVAQLKKSIMPDAQSDAPVELTCIPNAAARQVCCHGHCTAGTPIEDSAVLVVHDRRIFILSVDSSAADAPRARAALDEAVASIHWTR